MGLVDTMKIIIDTSVIIDYLRTKNLQSLFIRIEKTHEIVLSLITVAELYSGRSVQMEGEDKETLDGIVGGAEIIIPDLTAVKNVGRLRSEYQLSLGDAFVAALALDLNVPLATLDARDFKQIDGLKLWPEKQ